METLLLGRVAFSEELQQRILDAVADPAFCPFLRRVRSLHNDKLYQGLKEAMERRWAARDAAAGGV